MKIKVLSVVILGAMLIMSCSSQKKIMSPVSAPENKSKPAYTMFDASGQPVNYYDMTAAASQADFVLFGELHNNPISHWLQYELSSQLHSRKPIVMGFEMFERDNQSFLDDYLTGTISDKELDSLARLWNNYETDYRPLIDFAKDNNIPVAATNIPRRYASQVFKKGLESLDSLSAEEKEWIVKLPMEYDGNLPGYKSLLDMMADSHGGENFPKAQAIKDATMAETILKYYDSNKIFIHFNGAYHSDNYEGIQWYLKRKMPSAKYVTITTVEQTSIDKLEADNTGKADFTICVPASMTKTY